MQLFFAKVSRSATEDDVQQLFQQFGQVQGVNLFRAFQVCSAGSRLVASYDQYSLLLVHVLQERQCAADACLPMATACS